MKTGKILHRFLLCLFFLPVFFNLFSVFGHTFHYISKKNEKLRIGNVKTLYGQLNLCELGLSEKAFEYAYQGYAILKDKGLINNDQFITIVDFTKSSAQKRLYVIDLTSNMVVYQTYVAHGQHSGKDYANWFSNIPSSYQSSLGFYRTGTPYIGKNGYSLRLEGLEPGINDKAEERAIVMHGAPYVSESWIRTQGYIGRSWGCPAVPEALARPIIDKIKQGSCLFIYAENAQYQSNSALIKS